jgi:hypothetical protein
LAKASTEAKKTIRIAGRTRLVGIESPFAAQLRVSPQPTCR